MARYLRYALATFCFTASVGCVGLWVWTKSLFRATRVFFSGGAIVGRPVGTLS